MTLDRIDDLIGRQLIGTELAWINKQPEGRVTTSQQVHLSNTRDPLKLVVKLLKNQAIDIGGIILTLARRDLIGKQNRWGALHHRHTRCRDLLGQLGHGQGNAVLNVYLVDIDIRAFVKINLNDALTGIRAS